MTQQNYRLWMVPALKDRQRNGEFGWCPDDKILEAALKAGAKADEKGVVTLDNTRESAALLREVGTVPADKAKDQFVQVREKLANLEKYNKDLLEASSEFVAALAEAKLAASFNIVAAAAKGQRDFKTEVSKAWVYYRAAQAFILPKRKAEAELYFQEAIKAVAGDGEAEASIKKAYAPVVSDEVTIGDVEKFIRDARDMGVTLDRQKTYSDGAKEEFNTPQVRGYGQAVPSTPRGQRRSERGGNGRKNART